MNDSRGNAATIPKEPHLAINYRKNFLILTSGRVISEFGSSICRFGLSLYVLDLSHSPRTFAWFLNCSIIMGILVSLFAGSYIDRHNKKTLIIVTDVLSGLLSLAFIPLFSAIPGNIPVLLVYSSVIAILQSIYTLALTATIPEVVGPEKTGAANSLARTITTMVGVLGPISGALLYKGLGIKMVLYLDGVSFLVSGVSEIFLSFDDQPLSGQQTIGIKNYLQDIKLAMEYFRVERLLRFFLAIAVLISFVFTGLINLVLPYINYQVLKVSELQLSFILGGLAVGEILGAIYVATRKSVTGLLGKIFFFMQLEAAFILLWIFPRIIVFTDSTKWISTAIFTILLIITGALGTVQLIPLLTYFQLQIPEAIRARVLGITQAVLMLVTPLGISLYGQFLEKGDWIYIIAISELGIILIGFIAANNGRFQVMRRQIELNLSRTQNERG
jgi:DHA3 family macrolide efflux protein-like MFS transporter